MRDHAVVLPAVHALVADIAEQGLRGGKLVDAVQKRCTTGVPCVEVAMRRLLDVVHGLLLHQLNAWVVHGVLDDSNQHEFFVADALSYTSSSSEGGDVPSSRRGATEAVEPVHEWHSRFSLRAAMLPSCIPAVLGEKVVFIGKAVRVLTERCELVTIQDRQRFSNMLRMLLRNAAPATAAMERADEAPPSPVTTAEPTSVAAAAPESAVTRLPPRMSYNPVELSCTINELRAVVRTLMSRIATPPHKWVCPTPTLPRWVELTRALLLSRVPTGGPAALAARGGGLPAAEASAGDARLLPAGAR
jgi:hypothetical protein